MTKAILGVCAFAASALGVKTGDAPAGAIDKGVAWLLSVQGRDGGWGQDGGETSFVRQGERLETQGNDVANTAVAVMALTGAGRSYSSPAVRRGIEFVLGHVERSPMEGLAVTPLQGTQIQRKLGPFIDTFLAAKLLTQADGRTRDARLDARVRQALVKCVAKIERNQLNDGSWNHGGGWAPILGTSLASQSLAGARAKGVAVKEETLAKVRDYTAKAAKPSAAGARGDAGVRLYASAQALEQMSRSESDRKSNAASIGEIRAQLFDQEFQRGYGSMGGEEFFSYLNISESLKRTGGTEWTKWNTDMKTKLSSLQNNDGSWAGHHCITGRVAVTGAALLTMTAERGN
jgi:hypothetical protein